MLTKTTKKISTNCYIDDRKSLEFCFDGGYSADGYITISISTGKRTSQVVLQQKDFNFMVEYLSKA